MNGNSIAEHEFVKRVAKIVGANLQNEQFGVSELVREMRMSRSHIHRRLKGLTNLSISRFIRKIRLEKVMEMLKETDISASEITFKVGFSSPSYFNHCFHEHFGLTPGEVKKKIYSNDDKAGEFLENDKYKSETFQGDLIESETSRAKFKPSRAILLLAAILIFFFSTWLMYHFQTAGNARTGIFNRNKKELSLIVLPFKNLSDNPVNEYFADGLREDILNNLYWITSLRVVSNTTSENFRENKLIAREIARQMNVNYVLEGSVRRYDDKVRINIQLIDPKRDDHLWSGSFDRDMDNIIDVQNEIALKVADKLKTVIPDKEIRQIEKISTQNPKAYDYYLQARFLLHRANSP